MKSPRALWVVVTGAACLLVGERSAGQDAGGWGGPPQEQAPAQPVAAQAGTAATAATGAPLRLTLQDALDRARKNSTQFQAAVTNAGLAREDRKQAFASLLPTVTYNNSAIYTQGTGLANQAVTPALSPVVFIANNA